MGIKRTITNKLLKDLYQIRCRDIEQLYLNKTVEAPSRRVIWDAKEQKYRVKNIKGPSGINSIGFIKENIGLSHAARYFCRVLKNDNIPFLARQFEFKNDERSNTEFDEYMSKNLIYNTNVFNFNSNYCLEYYKQFPKDLENKYNIGYGYWEFDKYPLKFVEQTNIFDEIWAPTEFILKTLSQYFSIPVVYMPVAVDFPLEPLKKYDRQYFGLPQDRFIFVFNFDIGSEIGGRKNFASVIEAFKRAFPEKNTKAHLLIKTADRTSQRELKEHQEILDKLQAACTDNITLYSKTLTDEEMKGLLNACDVYVSLHRCEGLGLGMIESMKMGKPVIATAYSGNMDFTRYYNSCLVNCNLVPSKLFGSLIQGHVWADPDIDHAAYYMKKLYEDKTYYDQIAGAAKKFVDENHSYHVIGEKIRNRLKLLGLF